MSGIYRITRNVESSFIEFLRTELATNWSDIPIEKSFAKIYKLKLPSICVRVGTTSHNFAEIGNNNTIRTPQVLIDIFGTSSGLSLDLKDFILSKIKNGLPYYEYQITNRTITSKTQNGRIRIIDISDDPVNFSEDRNTLDLHDRYRWLLSLSVSLGKIES